MQRVCHFFQPRRLRPLAPALRSLRRVSIVLGCVLAISEFVPNEIQAQYIKKSVRHEGVGRTYHIRIPKNFDKSKQSPLVVGLHGARGEGREFDGITSGTLGAAADERGVVLVFPDGIDNRWSDGHVAASHDDVGFISKVIDRMIREYNIDAKRVYVTGKSNGGFMSLRLAIELTHKIAAIAPVTAQLTSALEGREPKVPVPLMMINGTADWLVPYEGRTRSLRGGSILSTDVTVKLFCKYNGCNATPTKRKCPDTARDDGTTVEVFEHTGGKDGSEVTLVKVIGGGHTWPGGKQYPRILGPVSRDINASEMIMDFFLRHSR